MFKIPKFINTVINGAFSAFPFGSEMDKDSGCCSKSHGIIRKQQLKGRVLFNFAV